MTYHVGTVMQAAEGGPFAPHPSYRFQYRFPQFLVTGQVPQNLLRATAKGCGPQGLWADCPGAQEYPLQQLGRLGRLMGLGDGPIETAEGGVSDIEKAPTPTQQIAAGIWGLASIAGTALGAYHGYKRNNSIGWGLWWGLMGGMFPVVTVPLALAQGFAKRRGR
jgi:hypothetical protein